MDLLYWVAEIYLIGFLLIFILVTLANYFILTGDGWKAEIHSRDDILVIAKQIIFLLIGSIFWPGTIVTYLLFKGFKYI